MSTYQQITFSSSDRLNKTSLAFFLLGMIFKELISFTTYGGFSDDYPLSRCLFCMFFSVLALLLLFAIPEVNQIKNKVDIIGNRLEEVERKMNGSDDENSQ